MSIDGLYVTQATQDYPNPVVPLVQDRSAWVRVFLKANEANTVAPAVRVQFINGTTTHTLDINASIPFVPTDINADTNASWNAAYRRHGSNLECRSWQPWTPRTVSPKSARATISFL
jgi:hypothetical protein